MFTAEQQQSTTVTAKATGTASEKKTMKQLRVTTVAAKETVTATAQKSQD